MKEININNGKIYFDEFTRYYYKSENEKLKKGFFENYTEYFSYIQQINYFDTIYYNITKNAICIVLIAILIVKILILVKNKMILS